MKRLTGGITVSVALAVLALLIGNSPSSSSDHLAKPGVTIRLLRPDGGVAKTFGPRVLVLLCNDSRDSVYLERDLYDIAPDSRQPLRVAVFDAESGVQVGPRFIHDRGPAEPLLESEFIELFQGCYGPIVDLRAYFHVEPGHRYKVRFTYQSHAPKRVGKIKPWLGKVTSETVLVEIPRK